VNCRHCEEPLALPFLDLGTVPPSNVYLNGRPPAAPDSWFPLRVRACSGYWPVQTEDCAAAGAPTIGPGR
jgi:Putative zinc binding domain